MITDACLFVKSGSARVKSNYNGKNCDDRTDDDKRECRNYNVAYALGVECALAYLGAGYVDKRFACNVSLSYAGREELESVGGYIDRHVEGKKPIYKFKHVAFVAIGLYDDKVADLPAIAYLRQLIYGIYGNV